VQPIVNGAIDLSADGALLGFIVPFNCVITSIWGFASNYDPVSIPVGQQVMPVLAIAVSGGAGNTFTPVPGAEAALLPGFSGDVGIGDQRLGSAAVQIPVAMGTRLALVGHITSTGTPIGMNLGFAGGISISSV